jgi:hypothetical protein
LADRQHESTEIKVFLTLALDYRATIMRKQPSVQTRPLENMDGAVSTFRTYDLVPASGIYEVFHPLHDLQDTVALFKGERFPACSGCNSSVLFALAREISALDVLTNLTIRVPLLTLQCVDKTVAHTSPSIERRL